MMRYSPLKLGKPLQRKKAISRGAGFSRASSKTLVAGAGVLRVNAANRAREAKQSKTATKAKPRATTAERAHLKRVAEMGCCLCRHLGLFPQPAEVHHVRLRHGWGRSGHLNTIPLCAPHHRGQPGGVHDMGREEFTAHYGISEIELLEAITRELANSETTTVAAGAAPEQITTEL